MAGRAAKKTVSFEDGLTRLEALTAQLEAGELPLEELLKRYEEGVKLATDLEKMLEAAKGRMQEITAGQGGAPSRAWPTAWGTRPASAPCPGRGPRPR